MMAETYLAEAEESLLSSILIDNDVLTEISGKLAPGDFQKKAHREIFAAAFELYAEGEPVDMVTLAERLRKKKRLNAAGGAAYLARIIETAPVAANPGMYADIIREKAMLRRLGQAAAAIARKCADPAAEPGEIIAEAQRVFFELTEADSGNQCASVGSLAGKIIELLEARQANPSAVTGVLSGFGGLDALTCGFEPGGLVILAARPSMGKTALALNMAKNAAMRGTPVLFISLEMAKEQLVMRLLSAAARIDSAKLKAPWLMDTGEWERLMDAAVMFGDAPIHIIETPGLSAADIRSQAYRMRQAHDIGLIVIDYIQLMRSHKKAERRELEIAEISRSLKGLAKELNIPVLALSQLNRQLENRSDKRPQLSDLRESGALEQDADMVIFIYRDSVYNPDPDNPERGLAEIHLAKNRNGPTGRFKLVFVDRHTSFEEMDFGA